MPLTQLDDAAALIVIDLQKGIVALTTAHPGTEVVGRVAKLARAFRERGLPVVLANVTGGAPGRTEASAHQPMRPPDWAELVPELDPQPGDHLITKQRWGAFSGTGLDDHLRKQGVTQAFIVGMATSLGVESTARGS